MMKDLLIKYFLKSVCLRPVWSFLGGGIQEYRLQEKVVLESILLHSLFLHEQHSEER